MSDFPMVERAAGESALLRLARRNAASVDAAWHSARVARVVRRAGDEYMATSIAGRIRWAGCTLAVAAIVHLGLRALLPATVAPALPVVAIGGLAVCGAIAAWQAAAFERAWRER